MRKHAALWISLAIVPAFIACKDNTSGTGSKGTTQGPDYTATNRNTGSTGNTASPATGASAGAGGQGTQGTEGMADRAGSPSAGTENAGDQGLTIGVAKLSARGSASFNGTARIHDVQANTAKVEVNLTNSTPGTYTGYVFDASDCTKAPSIDVDTGNVAPGSENEKDQPDEVAKVDDITIGTDGKVIMRGTATAIKGTFGDVKSFDKKIFVLYAKKPGPGATKVVGKTTAKGPEACGVISTTREQQTQG